MSSKVKPAIVLVHGAWHVPEHYSDFVQQLQQAGFEVFCPRLPTCDESKRLTADMFADAQVVRNQVVSLVGQSREIIMLLHSYGGAVGTEAVKGLSSSERATKGLHGGVVRLIYMCGFMLQVGESVGGASLPRPVPDPVESDAATGTTFLCEPPVQLFYADVEPQRAKKMVALLSRQSGPAMTDAITYPAWQHIPTTYLRTQEDQVLFPDWQERQIQAVRDAGASLTVETFKSSHSPFLSVPGDMVATIERAAEQQATA
ncbi:MAG: hypothetical protein ASARMPREDX12_000692 [Alectoria sarmentosa]|nr:MAG: hypothetical protein ASARMPREDX12_000692 [Alectoria sarmentosa]